MKVLAILSIHNGSKYLDDLLLSLRFLECGQLKVLFRFDGSDLDSEPIIRKHHGLDLIEVKSTLMPIGVRKSYELLLREASRLEFDFLIFLDQDDVHFPDRIKNLSKYSVSSSRPTILIGKGLISDKDLNIIGRTNNSMIPEDSNIFFHNQAIGCLSAINWVGVQELLKYLKYLPNNMLHDWAAYLVCGIYGDIFIMEDFVAIYRQHEQNVIGYELVTIKKLIPKLKKILSSENDYNQLYLLWHISENALSNDLLLLRSLTETSLSKFTKLRKILQIEFNSVPIHYCIYYKIRLIALFLLT